jgi:hypothetical protein
MARKWIETDSAFPKGLKAVKRHPQGTNESDAEKLWRQLTSKRDAALALSPELDEWFGKEFPPQFDT